MLLYIVLHVSASDSNKYYYYHYYNIKFVLLVTFQPLVEPWMIQTFVKKKNETCLLQVTKVLSIVLVAWYEQVYVPKKIYEDFVALFSLLNIFAPTSFLLTHTLELYLKYKFCIFSRLPMMESDSSMISRTTSRDQWALTLSCESEPVQESDLQISTAPSIWLTRPM